ncbi:TonB-dependent receptor domain-containing protein [Sphingomonas sp. TDK1]|uniref:TonB-dependent receptor domain-containing protein n=1 Tax=Sphingomonas sp. TDK1 TaxID=453247 RepID=UPI000AB502C7|nr:TonB-dependent receptor [Sphingomonas sp. TDK1]
MKFSKLLGATALMGSTMLCPALALAQTAQSDTATETQDQDSIVVTGSRLRTANQDSPVPITTVTADQIANSGRISVGDVLNTMPQLRSSVGSQNSTSGLGRRGQNFLDLRGLGISRTLTLINGRRQVTSDIINNGNAVDVNTIPLDLIERVDIVTGGKSAVYGSDAISGVVNFILKDHFDGLQLNGRAGVSKYGDAGNQTISLLAGKNFAEGRGNVVLAAEYSNQSDYYASDRPSLRRNDGFVIVDTDVGASSDDVPDRLFYRDIRSTTISLGGQLGFRYGSNGTRPCGTDAVGSAFTCAYLFQPGGALTPQTGLRVGLGPNGSFVGGNGSTGREGKLVVLSPNVKRYAFNALGHFEVSEAFVPFFEAKYVRTEAFGSQSGPFFSQGQTLSDQITGTGLTDLSYYVSGAAIGRVNREGIRVDNPYLNGAARNTITAQLQAAIASGVNPNTGAAITAAQQAASLAQVAAGTYRFSLRRNWVDLGVRDENIKREVYRFVGGARGDFGGSWHYEVSAEYSEHRETNVISGNVNRQRFLLANDTTRDANGNIVCRSQINPAYSGVDRGGNPSVLAADIAACVPLNPFGEGSVSDAARNYLLMKTTATGSATQFVGNGYVSGNLFELPGGPMSVAVGGEYRRETLRYDLDPLTQAGYAFYNAIPTFRSPAFEVKEAFGELSVPLLKDVPFFKELTVSGSGRVADYRGSTGTVFAYSGDAVWRPVRDFGFRGSYSRAVRAPYVGDLYAVAGQNFTPAPSDPCSARNINTGSANRKANCAAAGIPASYDYVYTSSLQILSGGNPNLKEESSRSWTLGAVFEPHWVPGLSFSVDYYDITVKNVITSPSVQSALNACYDAPSLNNQFCGLFKRADASGGPNGEQAFRIIEGSYQDAPQNYARYKARGIDTNITFNHRFDWGLVRVKGDWTHVIQRDNYTDPSRPNYKNVITGELNDPQDRFTIDTDLTFGKFSIGHTLRYISGMYLNTWEDYNSVNGEPPQNPDYAEIRMYPSVFYNDVRAAIEVNKSFNLYGGVNNIGNKNPPYGLTGVGTGSGIYDNRGRFFYMGFRANF